MDAFGAGSPLDSRLGASVKSGHIGLPGSYFGVIASSPYGFNGNGVRVHVSTTLKSGGRERFAQLTSTIGAGILGVGIGALLGSHIGKYAPPVLLLGLVMHAWGMLDMRRMEKAGKMPDRPVWYLVLYWVCWLSLLVVIGLVAASFA